MAEPWRATLIANTGLTVVMSGPCTYGGYRILGAAGANTMDVHDGVTTAGMKLGSAISVAAALALESPCGIRCANGLAVNMSGAPTAGQVLVLWR